jgi:hypothetical protein
VLLNPGPEPVTFSLDAAFAVLLDSAEPEAERPASVLRCVVPPRAVVIAARRIEAP